jgi:hypothetical protein
MTLLVSAIGLCTEFVDLLGASAVPVLIALIATVKAAQEWWKRRQAEASKASEVARLKADRNAHASERQRLEVELASIKPPPAQYIMTPLPVSGVPSASSVGLQPIDFKTIPPSEPPRDMAGDPVDETLETADTVPPRGKR